MKWFMTEYTRKDYCGVDKPYSTYCSYIKAPSHKAALRLAKKRGLREKVHVLSEGKPYHRPSEMMAAGEPALHVLHAVTNLTFLALKAKVASADELLGDTGLLHELVHHYALGPRKDGNWGKPKYRNAVLRKLKEVEAKVPGFY
jgi:hypothetical protein